jgi:hypothetical protein
MVAPRFQAALLFFFFLFSPVVLGFNLGASCLLGKHSIT